MDSQSEGAGVFTAAYRASEKVRIGGFVDYRASEKDSSGLKQSDTMPTFGAFAAYGQTGNATASKPKHLLLITAARSLLLVRAASQTTLKLVQARLV